MPLSTTQAARLRTATLPRLRWLNAVVKELDRLGLSPNDPLRVAAAEARARLQDLSTFAHYASVPRGVGEAEKDT